MADPKIKIRRSSTPNKVPNTTQLDLGELAINTYDGKIYLEQDQGAAGVGNTVVRINPWNVGLGTTAFNITFDSGKVGIGTTVARHALDVGGNARISGILTVGESSVTLNGGNNTVQVGSALSLGHSIGLQYHTQNLHAEGFLVNQIAASGIITAAGGIDGIGIHSAGTEIQVGVITSLNFIGTGNTFGVRGGTVDISIAGSGGGGSGAQGATGAQGASGSAGATGAQGAQGASGGGGGGGASVTVSSNPPGSPSSGDLWWDSDVGEMYVYYADGDSNQWVETSGGSETVVVSDNAPSSPNHGDLWWESDTGQLKIYYNDGDSAQWVDANAGVLSSLTVWQTNSTGINTTSHVGIGTTTADAALTVRGNVKVTGISTFTGDVNVGTSQASGVILSSPNGTKYRLIVANDGTLSTTAA